jgi:hypothetical protein
MTMLKALMSNNLDSIRGSLEEHVRKHHHFHPPIL